MVQEPLALENRTRPLENDPEIQKTIERLQEVRCEQNKA